MGAGLMLGRSYAISTIPGTQGGRGYPQSSGDRRHRESQAGSVDRSLGSPLARHLQIVGG